MLVDSIKLVISRQDFCDALGAQRGQAAFAALDARDGHPGNDLFEVSGYVVSVESRIRRGGLDAILKGGIGQEVEGLNDAEAAATSRGLASAPKFTQAENIIATAAAAALEQSEQSKRK